ncbi:MAG: hypothetical protein F4Y98_07000 [Chloroflexi bacterium]|nr:hypothetical protein [Chloroflexota bacterium]
MFDVAQAATFLDEFASAEGSLWALATKLKQEADDPEDPVVRAATYALGYRLLESSQLEARATYGGPFAPMAEMRDYVEPPYLSDLQDADDVVATWRELADSVQSPEVAARFCDLVWCTYAGEERHSYARRAIGGYLLAADSDHLDRVSVVKYLDRALDLARQISAADLISRVRDRINAELESALEGRDASSRPGIWGRLLNLLVGLDPNDRPPELFEQLVKAHGLAEDRPDVRQALFELEEVLAKGDAEEVRRIHLATAEMLIEHALQQANGLAREYWLREALTVATHKSGAASTLARISRELEEIDLESYDLQTTTVESEVPAEQVEAWLNEVVGDDDLDAALRRLAFADGPPIGDREEVERTADDLAQEFVFKNLFGRVIIDDHGYPIRHVETASDRRQMDILDHDVRGIYFDALLRQVALDRIGEKYAHDRDALSALFEADLISADEADAFARALESYWADCPDEALHVALPRVEAVLRRWLAMSGGLTYRPPRGSTPGRVRGLDSVLSDLSVLYADLELWWRYFRVALTIPSPGLNLRNRYLHGLAGTASKQDAAIVLRIAAGLRFVEIEAGSADQTPASTD